MYANHRPAPPHGPVLGVDTLQAVSEDAAAAARTAMLFSRTNTLLSVPMLFAMVSAQNLYNVAS